MGKHTTSGITRRAAIALLAAGLGPVVLAACAAPAPQANPPSSGAATAPPTPAPVSTSTTVSSTAPPTTASQPAATAAPATQSTTAAAPKDGGTIRTGQVGDIANLDGHYSNQLSSNTVQLAYDKLA